MISKYILTNFGIKIFYLLVNVIKDLMQNFPNLFLAIDIHNTMRSEKKNYID